MTWELLNSEINKYTKRQQQLQQIAAIVAQHPEWLKAEPELAKLLKAVTKKSA